MPNQTQGDIQSLPEIIFTRNDAERLDGLAARLSGMSSSSGLELLLQELLRARIVEPAEIPESTVRMHSRVAFRDEDSGLERVVRLVYPGEQKAYDDAISVVSPVGAALIGLSEGQSISFVGVDKRPRRITVLRVQPGSEASEAVGADRH